jgi:transposase
MDGIRRRPPVGDTVCPDSASTYGVPADKVKLGFVEGINNKIRVIRRRASGYRDEEYLRLEILTAFLPEK